MSEPDNQLIAEFNARRSEEAFAALVRQHVNLVFATALRQVGDAGAAEEITQNVFVALAQAAGKLGSHPTIAGWLHQTALNKSREWLRSELRRRKREQVAVNLDLARAEGDSVWSSLVPLLDEALLELREPDRLAVILHFMEGRTFHEVGSALGIGEDTARKRVNRCLDQLTHFFRRRGFAAPALVAGAPLFALSSHAAPAGLAASATTAGLAAAHSATTSTLTLIKGALKIMAWTKAKTAIVTGAILVAAVGTTTITLNEFAFRKPASHPDASSPGGLNETNPVEYYIQHTPLLQNNEQLRSDLVGTWKLTGAKSLKTGKFVVLAPENRFYKTFTLTDWSTVSYDSNSNLLNSAGGPYTINGELCKETIATATGEKSQFLGARVPFRIRVIGDDYYQMGSGSHPSVEQQWHRVRD